MIYYGWPWHSRHGGICSGPLLSLHGSSLAVLSIMISWEEGLYESIDSQQNLASAAFFSTACQAVAELEPSLTTLEPCPVGGILGPVLSVFFFPVLRFVLERFAKKKRYES